MSRETNKAGNSRGSGQVAVDARAHHCAFPSCAASSPPLLDDFRPAKVVLYRWSVSWSCVVVVKLVAVVADVGWMSGAGPVRYGLEVPAAR